MKDSLELWRTDQNSFLVGIEKRAASIIPSPELSAFGESYIHMHTMSDAFRSRVYVANVNILIPVSFCWRLIFHPSWHIAAGRTPQSCLKTWLGEDLLPRMPSNALTCGKMSSCGVWCLAASGPVVSLVNSWIGPNKRLPTARTFDHSSSVFGQLNSFLSVYVVCSHKLQFSIATVYHASI